MAPPPPKPTQPSTLPKLYDYDKLIVKSGWSYYQWWILWKRIHPEWALIPEKETEKVEKLQGRNSERLKPVLKAAAMTLAKERERKRKWEI